MESEGGFWPGFGFDNEFVVASNPRATDNFSDRTMLKFALKTEGVSLFQSAATDYNRY